MAAIIQAGTTCSPINMIIVPSTSTLSAIGSRSEPSGEVRPWRRASRPSKKSVVIAAQKTPVAQYAWPWNGHAKRTTTTGTESARATVS